MKLKNTNNKSLLNISAFCDQWKMMPNLNMSHEKMSNYVSFSMFGFTVVIKQEKFNFECHWNTLIFFDKKYMASDWNMSHWKMPYFVSLSWFMFTFVIKLRNLECLIWFKLCCLSTILAISWEIWILNFIKSLVFFTLGICFQNKICPFLFVWFVFFWHFYRNSPLVMNLKCFYWF